MWFAKRWRSGNVSSSKFQVQVQKCDESIVESECNAAEESGACGGCWDSAAAECSGSGGGNDHRRIRGNCSLGRGAGNVSRSAAAPQKKRRRKRSAAADP